MRYIRRQLEEQVLRAVKGFPAVVLTGPRRAIPCEWLLRRITVQPYHGAALRYLLRRVFHSQDLHGAAFGQHTIENDVVWVRDKLSDTRQTAGPAKLGIPC
jgi:hypothetical protein